MKNTKNIQHDVGFLLYNIPTPTLDYTKIAQICVRHLKYHMPNIPIAVCGEPVDGADILIQLQEVQSNQRMYVHENETVNEIWYNLTRDRSLEITPFERTVLLDSDYIVQSKQLDLLFQSKSPIMMYDKIYNIEHDSEEIEYLGKTSIPLKWATVIAFDHSEVSKKLFFLWKKILLNYSYYTKLYKWKPDGTIWNDKAITIAHQQLTDYNPITKQYIIQWNHPLANFSCQVVQCNTDKIILQDKKSKFQVHTDVHILNKKELL